MLTYQELCQKTPTSYISYSELLLTQEWHERRNTILARDNHHCTKCGKGETVNDYDKTLLEPFYLWIDETEITWVEQDDGTFKDYEMPKIEVADKPYHMEVHHQFYIVNRLPWNYDDDALVTMCNWCHAEYHKQHKVDVFAEDGITLVKDLLPCRRCQGAGVFQEYAHVQGGLCFRCGGAKYELPLIKI